MSKTYLYQKVGRHAFNNNINNTVKKKTPGPAGFNGGTTVSISLIPEGFMAKIYFTKNRKNR